MKQVLTKAASVNASPSVHETLKRPGEPLTEEVRDFFEERFGHDFGKVRVHADARAARSADDVHALAYTVGSDIVFGDGGYRPESPQGRQLLAHELTHVVQQGGVAGGSLMRQAKAQEFAGFSQADYDSCGAASLVSALIIWDKERKDPGSPNTILITACNTILVYLDDHKRELKAKMGQEPLKGGGTANGSDWFDSCVTSITTIRNAVKAPGGQLSQALYEELGATLYLIYKNSGQAGMTQFNIERLRASLGLDPGKTEQGNTFDELMDKLAGLQPGQAAQVEWYSRTKIQPDGKFWSTRHVFLAGRFQRGSWYVSDQGSKPPTELEAPSLDLLKSAVKANTAQKDSGILTGGIPVQDAGGGVQVVQINAGGHVTILRGQQDLNNQAQGVIMKSADFLAEVDASVWHNGDSIVALGFVDRTDNLSDAKKALIGAGASFGGVIVENPKGLFHVFNTSLVSDNNVNETSIDEGDSAGGKLLPSRKLFYSAYLRLRSPSKVGTIFQVY